ncbi:hypothetical protein CDAR_11501 [Caerostris darwini]|uniref:Uncharacterized protein n=1 Tax=Caerostris darwini TaxID=1538125 RepID=A0AAV4R8J1_9ARAC|nr:hypothetical protein CDAR_11501 [Caerostris darwini]
MPGANCVTRTDLIPPLGCSLKIPVIGGDRGWYPACSLSYLTTDDSAPRPQIAFDFGPTPRTPNSGWLSGLSWNWGLGGKRDISEGDVPDGALF